MQSKDKYNNSSPMKYILLGDIIKHPNYSKVRLDYINISTGDMFLKLFELDVKKLDYSFLQDSNTIQVHMRKKYDENFFNLSKLHWLIHDFKTNGVSFAPQGFLQKDDDDNKNTFATEIHPGTYRFLAMILGEMYNEHILVADKENYFPNHPELSFEEHKKLADQGFIRERKGSYSEIEVSQRGENIYTVHEGGNHHDWNIIIQSEELAKMYTKVTIYTDDEDCVARLNLLETTGVEIKIANQGYAYIPFEEQFNGVSVYIPKSDQIEDAFTYDKLLHLDIDTDIVFYTDTGVTIINNGSVGCKRLIPEIIKESKPEYLDNFLWARRVIRI